MGKRVAPATVGKRVAPATMGKRVAPATVGENNMTDRELNESQERGYQGLAVGPGIAIGVACIHDVGNISAPEYRVAISAIPREKARFAEAVQEASHQIANLQTKAKSVEGAAGEDLGYLLDAYQQMLKGSRLVRGVEKRIVQERQNAEAAIYKEVASMAEAFTNMDDAYLAARISDIRDVGNRLVRCLTKTPYRTFSMLPNNAVIIAEDLTPADTALLDPNRVAGFATVLGGAESHTAIMARSLNFPAVVAIQNLLKDIRTGDIVIIDGLSGMVIVAPKPETLLDFRRQRARFIRERHAMTRLKMVPAISRDGIRVGLFANVEMPTEATSVLQSGALGIGLLRSEFMFMNRDDLPGEEEQFEGLRQLVEQMEGRPVTIRTLDCGGDKVGVAFGMCIGPNPALGLRAIRLCLNHPELLDTQLAAILRAGAFGPVRILLPLVTTVEELVAVRGHLIRVASDLRRRMVKIPDQLPPLGIMIEVPGAALAADALARHADFFAIGTNDLTQYTLAIDRTDEAVAHLYNPLHPAVLRLIQFSTAAALRAHIPLSVCGEMAGDPRFTALLIGLGIRDLSMSTNNIPRVKQRIRALDIDAATRNARLVMEQSDSALITQLVDDFNSRI